MAVVRPMSNCILSVDFILSHRSSTPLLLNINGSSLLFKILIFKAQNGLEMKEAVHVEVAEEISPELEKLLHTEPLAGLTDAEVAKRLEQFGKNEIPEHKTNPLLKFLSYFLGAISYLLEAACLLSVIFGDYIDFGILIFVLIANACIGYFEEARAESALDALKNTLALKSRCWRNSKLVEVDSALLVPGDIIALVSYMCLFFLFFFFPFFLHSLFLPFSLSSFSFPLYHSSD